MNNKARVIQMKSERESLRKADLNISIIMYKK